MLFRSFRATVPEARILFDRFPLVSGGKYFSRFLATLLNRACGMTLPGKGSRASALFTLRGGSGVGMSDPCEFTYPPKFPCCIAPVGRVRNEPDAPPRKVKPSKPAKKNVRSLPL